MGRGTEGRAGMASTSRGPGAPGRDVDLDLERCEALISATLAGDGKAFRRLCADLWPFWMQIARRTRSLTLLGRGEDGVRDVATDLAEKLGREDHRALGQYRDWREAHAEKTFGDWMLIVTSNAIRSYVRRHTAAGPADGSGLPPSRNRVLKDFFATVDLEEVGESPSMTPRQTARQVVEFAEGKLPGPQLRALASWLEGSEAGEIADELGLRGGAEEAKKLVRAACATLRREFGG